MKENMLKELKKGFSMNRWSLEFILGAVIMMFTWTQLENDYDTPALPLKIFSTLVFIAGIALFFYGRKLVKAQVKLLKQARKRNAEEEWFLQEMSGYVDKEGHEELLKKLKKSAPNREPEIRRAVEHPGLLGKYFSIGAVYAEKRFLLAYLPVILSIIISMGYILVVR